MFLYEKVETFKTDNICFQNAIKWAHLVGVLSWSGFQAVKTFHKQISSGKAKIQHLFYSLKIRYGLTTCVVLLNCIHYFLSAISQTIVTSAWCKSTYIIFPFMPQTSTSIVNTNRCSTSPLKWWPIQDMGTGEVILLHCNSGFFKLKRNRLHLCAVVLIFFLPSAVYRDQCTIQIDNIFETYSGSFDQTESAHCDSYFGQYRLYMVYILGGLL